MPEKVIPKRVMISVDRSTTRDMIGIARVAKRDKTKIVVLYRGTKAVRFVPDSGGMRCVKCSKVRSTIHGIQKHYKKAHGN